MQTFHSKSRRRVATAVAALAVALAVPAVAQAAQVRVVIDPGHGGKDPGAIGAGVLEKNANLTLGRAVADEARRQGWSVAMTRNSDRFIPLTKRPALANRIHSDVFVSVHRNSTGNKALGNMTIYRSAPGKKLGAAIMSELAPLTPYSDIGNRRDVRGLAVLRASRRPAVIVEALSVTSPTERAQILNGQVQQKYAQAIVRGIAKYKGVAYKPLPSTTPTTPPVSQPPTSTPTTPTPTSTPTTPTPTPTPTVEPVTFETSGYDIQPL